MIHKTWSAVFLIGAVLATNPAAAGDADPSTACEQAAQQAELAHDLPHGLLAAIGRVESGRRDPATGQLRPWPWTLNVNGQGAYFPDQTSAAAAVAGMQARGQRSIDVGCFQVNLSWHPAAFPSVADSFVPGQNADYAARFLRALWQRSGNWADAVMAYHSSSPGVGEPYWLQVQANWPGGDNSVTPSVLAASPKFESMGIHIFTPAPPGTAPVAIHIAARPTPAFAVVDLNNQARKEN